MKAKIDRVLVALLLLATLVRFPGMGRRSLWFDEALSGLIARLSATDVLTNAAGSSHPPGYYFLLHLWHPMGKSEFALRFPSACFSLLAVAIVARLGRDLFGRRTARLAALGMSISPFQVYYAQEARMYGLAIALSAGLLWAFLQAIRRGDYSDWALYIVITALGLYVHYYVGLVALALHLWLFTNRSRALKRLRPLLTADALVGIIFAPQSIQFVTESTEYLTGLTSWQSRPSILSPLTSLYYLVFGHALPLRLVGLGLFFVVSLIVLAALSQVREKRGSHSLMLLLVISVPILLALVISFVAHPIYLERSFAVVTPALFLLLAFEIVGAPSRSPTPYLGAALGCLMAVGTALHHLAPEIAKPPVHQAVELVAREARSTDTVLHLQDASYVPALYYQTRSPGLLVNAGQGLWLAPEVYQLFDGRTVRFDNLSASGRTWVVLMPGYLAAAQTELLERWNEGRTVVSSWGWRTSGTGKGARDPVQVRLYSPEEAE